MSTKALLRSRLPAIAKELKRGDADDRAKSAQEGITFIQGVVSVVTGALKAGLAVSVTQGGGVRMESLAPHSIYYFRGTIHQAPHPEWDMGVAMAKKNYERRMKRRVRKIK